MWALAVEAWGRVDRESWTIIEEAGDVGVDPTGHRGVRCQKQRTE